MTQQEIIEGNKLIAEFMGKEVQVPTTFFSGKTGTVFMPVDKVKDWTKAKLYYHTSLGALMQVVDKIEKHFIHHGGKNSNIQINTLSMAIEFTDKANPEIDYYDQYKIESFESKIAMVFCAVVDFITWFNSLSK